MRRPEKHCLGSQLGTIVTGRRAPRTRKSTASALIDRRLREMLYNFGVVTGPSRLLERYLAELRLSEQLFSIRVPHLYST